MRSVYQTTSDVPIPILILKRSARRSVKSGVLVLHVHDGSHPASSSHWPYAVAWAVLPYAVHGERLREPRVLPARAGAALRQTGFVVEATYGDYAFARRARRRARSSSSAGSIRRAT